MSSVDTEKHTVSTTADMRCYQTLRVHVLLEAPVALQETHMVVSRLTCMTAHMTSTPAARAAAARAAQRGVVVCMARHQYCRWAAFWGWRAVGEGQGATNCLEVNGRV